MFWLIAIAACGFVFFLLLAFMSEHGDWFEGLENLGRAAIYWAILWGIIILLDWLFRSEPEPF